jgi:hypothetical protein
MYNKILCIAAAFALSLSVWAEDLQSVMSFYKPDMSKGFIFVSKVDMTLTLVNSQGNVVVTYPIACGRRTGQKIRRGDNKTPEGYFLLEKIHDSTNWGHDFHDGKGFIKHAYGPFFLRLRTGFQGIGIHGTHAPSSIGTRATEGCIRLENDNVEALEHQVVLGMPVIIGPEEGVKQLIASNAKRPNLPYWTTGGSMPVREKTAPAPKRKPKVIDGKIDIDPELDLIDNVEEITPVPATTETETPVEKQVVEEVIETPVEKQVVEEVIEKQVVEEVIETPVEQPTEIPAEKSAKEVVEEVVNEEPKEPEPLQVEMVIDKAENGTEASNKAPKYEVVVEEVTAPDGTVKYEVHYKPVQ